MKIPEEVGSKYRLIVIAGQRVAQLQKGARPRVEIARNAKFTEIAMQEVLENRVNFLQKGHIKTDLRGNGDEPVVVATEES